MSRETTLYTYMTRSHDYLRDLLERLLDAMRVDAPDVRGLWSELEHGLLTHMEAEERFVLPSFAHVDRDEAMALLREHGELREHLLELCIAVDLHLASFERSRRFADALRRHAAREENLLYRWADENLDHRYVEKVEAHVGGPARRWVHAAG
jgi:hemerythrin-like domain-containing protein